MIRHTALASTFGLFLATAALLFSPLKVSAEPGATASAEIDHLLKFVTDSSAVFIRNGDNHSAKDAAKHIKAKYDHYLKKISSAEDFVRLAATKSALSGNIYKVKLKDGTTIANSEWLLAELKRYRAAAAAAKTPAAKTAE